MSFGDDDLRAEEDAREMEEAKQRGLALNGEGDYEPETYCLECGALTDDSAEFCGDLCKEEYFGHQDDQLDYLWEMEE